MRSIGHTMQSDDTLRHFADTPLAAPSPDASAGARVLLVEDDRRLAELIAEYLGRNGLDITWVERGDVALARAERVDPDLLLLDVMLPGMDGFEICRQLRARGAQTPILFLTARDEDIDRVVGLELGADEFLAKPIQPRVLLAHVRAILRRTTAREKPAEALGESLSFGALHIDGASREVRLGRAPVDLTSSEFELLWLLATHAGKVLSRHEILQRLRSLDYDGSDRSVDCRVYRVRRKLGDLVPGAQRIKTIRNVGYHFSPTGW